MSDKTREELQTQLKELQRRLNKTLRGSPKEQELLTQIQELKGKIQETVEPASIPFDVSPHEVYLRQVLATMSRLELSGIDRKATGNDVTTCLDLGAIYTALLTLSADHSERGMGMERGKEDRRLSALDMLNRHERLVLLGDPGSGKSTFVKFVTMCLAGELLGTQASLPVQGEIGDFVVKSRFDTPDLELLTAPLPDEDGEDQEDRQPWDHTALLPVRIILRDFAAKGLPPQGQQAMAQHLWDFIVGELEAKMLGNYATVLQQHLQEHGGLILLDGLDEVPEAEQRRIHIRQVVEDFTLTFAKCRFAVTSRTYAYQQQDWKLSGFTETVLTPFTQGQIRRFVDRWYHHIAEVRGMDQDNAQGRAEILKRAIFQSERLRDFAQRPLLLTLMASLHAWRGGSLPEKRGELYAEATDLLLDWWERDKVVRNAEGQIVISQPSLSELLRIGKDRVQQILNILAFEAHQSQPDLVGTADVSEERLVGQLMQICRNDNVNPVLLVKHLSDRAGLLVPHGVGVYSFPHRTFQEYLAACYLTGDQDYPDNVADLVHHDPERWREVVLLAAARASDVAPMIWALVEALCYQDVTEELTSGPSQEGNAEDAWGALLAGQALVETTDLKQVKPRNQKKLKRVRDWLVAILTERQPSNTPFPVVERALAGNILAHLGDPRPGIGLQEDGLPDIVWCQVPAGSFLMGSNQADDPEAYEDEQPQHTVSLSAYSLSRYPVTNAQFQQFVKDGGYTEKWKTCWTPEGWAWKEQDGIVGPELYGGTFDLPNHPIVGVSWYEAIAFCRWLTLCLRKCDMLSDEQEITLPSEAQWERAARGVDGRIYPWGDEQITPEHANYYDTQLGVTSTVGCFSRDTSPYDCQDMAGNVIEWCLDRCDFKDIKVVTDTYKDGLVDPVCLLGSARVVRGGYWGSDAGSCRAADRGGRGPGDRGNGAGFRLVRTTPD